MTSTDSDLVLGSLKTKEELSELLTVEEFNTLKQILVYIADGMDVEEACILTDTDYESFTLLMQKEKVVAHAVRKQQLKFKQKLLNAMSGKLQQSGGDKVAQWFLETRYSDEYNKKVKPSDTDKDNIVTEAIAFIRQQSQGPKDLIKDTSGRALVVDQDEHQDVKQRRKGRSILKAIHAVAQGKSLNDIDN